MTIRSRTAGGLKLFALTMLGAAMFACSGDSSSEAPPSQVPSGARSAEGPIPAPDTALTDSSPASAFLRYGDSLRFAVDSPGTVTLTRAVNGIVSELRVRSELRLPNTDSAAYVRGRIIAKFETVRAGSAYNTPIGNAYLWVRDTGGHNFVGTLITRNYATGDTSKVLVSMQRHSGPRSNSGVLADCIEIDDGAVSTGVCCLCGSDRWNCPLFAIMTASGLDSALSRKGKSLRVP